jgi:hypothetical protein
MLYDYSNPRIDDWMDEFENGRFGNSVDEFACEAIVVGTEGNAEGLPIAEPMAEPIAEPIAERVRESYGDEEKETIEWGGVHGAIVGITILCCGCNRVEGVVMGTVLSLVVQRLF